MEENSYKKKYAELKAKWMESVDLAFRLGLEQGMQQAQLESMQQEQAMQAQQQEVAAAQGGQPGQPGQNPEEQAAPQENPMGSELDQHLNELESMLGKSEISPDDLKKAINSVKSLKQTIELKKSAQAIKGIAAVLHKPAFKMGKQATHQLDDNAKRTLTLQEQIVNDVFKSWDTKEQKATNGIQQILEIEGLVKKD